MHSSIRPERTFLAQKAAYAKTLWQQRVGSLGAGARGRVPQVKSGCWAGTTSCWPVAHVKDVDPRAEGSGECERAACGQVCFS